MLEGTTLGRTLAGAGAGSATICNGHGTRLEPA
jgi:hypothetical protein